MEILIERIVMTIYLVICLTLVFLTLMQNRRSEGLGAAITGQADMSRGTMGREEKLSQIIRNLSWTFLAGSFLVSLFLRKLW